MKVAFIATVWPEPTSSAAGGRVVQLLEAFLSGGWDCHCLSASVPNSFSEALEKRGVRTQPVELNRSSFDSVIGSIAPDAVVFDRFVTEEQFGWRVRENCPGALRVLDTSDLHFLRRAREAALAAGAKAADITAARIPLDTEDALREIASIYRSDLTLILSDFEMRLLEDRFHVPPELIQLCRFFCPTPGPSPGFGERAGFAFIGNFRHPPNADAVRWLHAELWPKIRPRVPHADLSVYGAYPPREMMSLDDPRSGFRVRGPAEDAVAALKRHRVNLAPLRFGAGIKGKLVDGWEAGTPAAATTLAAEGMTDGMPFGGVIADDADALADAALRLHENEGAWHEGHQQGRALLLKVYGATEGSRRLLRRLTDLASRVQEVRDRNFTGRMLWHHMHRSTEYFSRWIELKNAL